MSDTIELEIVTPDRKVLSVQVSEIVLPGIEGYFGVLPGHAPLLTQLGVGEITYRDASGTHYLAVAEGAVEVLPDRVTILARLCESAREIDVARAREAKQRAEEAMKQAAKLSDQDMVLIETSLKKALTRLHVAGRVRA
ncbi:MAG TPA: F0F1 ATP synthase subunit epsilon [Candidatus Polarisedimenticolaceae bacterium]|nr:F0F1 ATP synthase subunit epsilon [Candidatus Polarisedimenticolaceae bacterium]